MAAYFTYQWMIITCCRVHKSASCPCLLACCIADCFRCRPRNSCFCSIKETDGAAVVGGYYGWSTPYNYLDAYQMQLDTNVLVNGTCLASNDTYDMVVCPPSTYKLPESDIQGLCNEQGLPCPAVSCHCSSAFAATAAAVVAQACVFALACLVVTAAVDWVVSVASSACAAMEQSM